MSQPLWTDEYAPELIDLPGDSIRSYLTDAVDEPINLLFHGPAGTGKTAAARALADESHPNPEADLVELNIADFFNRTKKEIRNDPRFEQFLQGQTEFSKQYRSDSSNRKYKRNWSKREMVSHVLKELAAYAPADGTYKTIVLDNAEAIREDFQQALRRVMEQYHETTQFIICTRQPSKLIPPIRSRCFPLSFNHPSPEFIEDRLTLIADGEGISYEDDALTYLAGYADGNIRTAILALQTISDNGTVEKLTLEEVHSELQGIGIREELTEMLDHAENGDFKEARSILDDLLVDGGHSAPVLLESMLDIAHSGRYSGSELTDFVRAVGDVDLALTDASSERIQLSKLLADRATA